ncbi:MAG: M48 family metallopeptidase [Candidatus Sericytochromatia bacterium]
MSTQTLSSPAGNTFECSFCGHPNAISPQALDKVQVRCARCKLQLKRVHHAKFKHLDPAVYRHPLAQEAQLGLERLPGLQAILQKVQPLADQLYAEAYFAANSLRVSEQQYPDLHAKLVAACRTLGLNRVPHLYVSGLDMTGELGVASYCGGVELPFVVLSADLLASFDEQDVLATLAHELGHIHCGHLPYKLAADHLALLLSKTYRKTPLEALADTITQPIQQALLIWRQKANLSADRSAMLVTQDERTVLAYLMKQAGGVVGAKANLEAFREQARQSQAATTLAWLEKYWPQMLYMRRNPPFAVWRAAELMNWYAPEKKQGYGYQEIVKIFAA